MQFWTGDFMKKNIECYTLLLCAIMIAAPLFSQELSKERVVFLSNFQPFRSEKNSKIENQIYESLRSKFEANAYKVIPTNGSNLSENLRYAKSNDSAFLIEGYYQAGTDLKNLSIYVQIYNPATGYIIDAITIVDENDIIEGVQLDPKELKEKDETIIAKISNKVSTSVRTNLSRKENRENINQNLLTTKLAEKNKFPISDANKAAEEATADVFNLLQNQVTTSATKIAKKTSEAPNVVSVISHKEISDYGRVSINDILYQLPGFSPSQDYDRRTVSSRGAFEGWNNNHLLVLMDGIQFNDSLYGSAYTWEITPLNMIKSLEVIRGPGSALYGSNATNGVVSINTFSGSDLGGGIKTRIRGGNAGTRIYDIITGNKGNLFSYVASYNSYQTDGNNYKSYDGSSRTDPAFPNYLQKFTTNDARDNSYLFTKIEGEGVLKGLSIQYHRQNWNFQTGQGWLWRTPDIKEAMAESRQILTMKYTKNITDNLIQEYAVKYQNRSIDWNTRYAENGAYAGYYPAGITEYLKTGSNDIFGRGQLTYIFPNGGTALGGVEANQFSYTGDKEHYSNINLSDSVNAFPPNDGSALTKQRPWLEWIKNKPIPKVAVFAQATTGKLLNRSLEFTLGIRYDETQVRFRGVDQPRSSLLGTPSITDTDPTTGTQTNYPIPPQYLGSPFVPNEKRTFRRTSPRLGVVYTVSSNLTLKLMAGKAFREPSITEMFGYNTFSLASNPRKLKPEIIHTYEAGVDWFVNKYINLRANLFRTRYENQIAYSVANSNLSTNLYTLITGGVESEALVSYKNFSGFANFSYNKRINEFIQDRTISINKTETTWVPSHTANAGITWTDQKFMTSLSVERQGAVYRRNSDLGPVDPLFGNNTSIPPYNYNYPVYRPKTVAPWISFNFRFMYKWNDKLEMGLNIMNLLNSYQTLAKNNNYPFDYVREGRRFLFDVTATF